MQPGDPCVLPSPPRGRQAQESRADGLHAETPDDLKRHDAHEHDVAPDRSITNHLTWETVANASRLTRPRRAPRLVPPRGAIGGPTRRQADEHVLIPTLKRQLVDRLIARPEFLRYAALLGRSATAAYASVRNVTGDPLVAHAT